MARSASPQTAAPPAPAVEMLASMDEARRETLALLAHLDDAELERVRSPLMSPLAWDLAHIAAYEDLWLAHRHADLPLLRGDLAERYDAFETPRAVRGEVELLDAPAAREYLRAVRERVVEATLSEGVGDGLLHELVLRHELQHTETMRQTLALAGLLGPEDLARRAGRANPDAEGAAEQGEREKEKEEGGDWVELPAGMFTMGAGTEGFAYDNERPGHLAETGAFRIARRPVSNAAWLRFSEDGGYERREWWSPEGWAWKQEQGIGQPPAVAGRLASQAGGTSAAGAWREEHGEAPHPAVALARAGRPHSAVCHVSWFEADAFARSRGARLPTEAEWERAARTPRRAARPGRRITAGRFGLLDGVGQVWEWTASAFRGYPGFVAHPYREYSEVFFGEQYRVLRGGSWATHPRVATVTFRNWDLPIRRQIFAGVRLAEEAA